MLTEIKQEKIKAIKEKNSDMKMACNMILSEIPRLNLPYYEGMDKDDQVTNTEIIQIINKLIKSELMTLEYSGQDENEYVKCLKSFLPDMIDEFQIRRFLSTIDFTKLKNKMQAIGMIKKHFGESVIDSNFVKRIIERDY